MEHHVTRKHTLNNTENIQQILIRKYTFRKKKTGKFLRKHENTFLKRQSKGDIWFNCLKRLPLNLSEIPN